MCVRMRHSELSPLPSPSRLPPLYPSCPLPSHYPSHPPSPPDRPATVNISTLSSSLISLLAARLTWTPPADNNAPIINYTISVCVNTSGCSSNGSFTTYTSNSTTVDVEVLPNRTHVVRISATNKMETSDDSDDGTIDGARGGTSHHCVWGECSSTSPTHHLSLPLLSHLKSL